MSINLIEHLERNARKFPDKLAISDEKFELTFYQLREKVMAAASFIIGQTDGKSQPIAIEVDKCTQSVVMFLAVLYSGNFYIPIDNKMPDNRVNAILEDVNPCLCLDIGGESFFERFNVKKASYDEILNAEINSRDLGRIKDETIDIDPCYMIYTSGSTGTPKGVIISHRMVMDFIDFLTITFNINEDDILANQAPFYFDCSVKCIYEMVMSGCTMYIMPQKYFIFPLKAVEFFNEKKITTLLWATSGLNIISSSGVFNKLKPETVNKVFFSGELLYAKDYLLWKDACPDDSMFINLYGPTEVTVDCAYYIIDRKFNKEDVIPIGKACRNMNVYILNENNDLVRGDEIGEICSRGTGISYGYYNSEEMTNEVFVQNPFVTGYRDIIYRTGDLGRYNEHGEIVYISRKDNQVKHMGNRVELGEIEALVSSMDRISEAVIFYDHKNKEIILACETDLEKVQILDFIKSKLPKYMLPREVLIFDKLPRNRNGKVDRSKIREDYLEKAN